jgi:hypothetical protein
MVVDVYLKETSRIQMNQPTDGWISYSGDFNKTAYYKHTDYFRVKVDCQTSNFPDVIWQEISLPDRHVRTD